MTGRKRLSRQEAQVQTRERLIEAARRLFVQHGFAGTSLRDIAEEAGYSQGAFYSNFTCKEAVLLELLKRHIDLDDDQIATIVDDRNLTVDAMMDALQTWFERLAKDRTWSVLTIELQLHALRSPTFAESYAGFWQEHERRVAGLVTRTFARLGKAPPAPAEQLAAGLTALANGLVVQESTTRSPRIAATMVAFLKALLAGGSHAHLGRAS
ncbi:TetR/AcrR family transcriptional regulator [Bradyrhizobium cenepequi]